MCGTACAPSTKTGTLWSCAILIISATGFTGATGLTFQWQSNTNAGGWINVGASSGTYSNVTATAPALGTTVLWQLIVTCTSSGQSATSTNGTFTSLGFWGMENSVWIKL